MIDRLMVPGIGLGIMAVSLFLFFIAADVYFTAMRGWPKDAGLLTKINSLGGFYVTYIGGVMFGLPGYFLLEPEVKSAYYLWMLRGKGEAIQLRDVRQYDGGVNSIFGSSHILVGEWKNPRDSKTYEFESLQYIGDRGNQPVTVWIDPTDPTRYWFDLNRD
jgi:hypothetical protein